VGESPEWTSIVNSAEENRTNFSKYLDGKPLFSALYSMYTVTLNELKAVVCTGKTQCYSKQNPMEPTAQDDEFRKVKRSKRHNSNGNSQSAK
jgi:hypothetical protein